MKSRLNIFLELEHDGILHVFDRTYYDGWENDLKDHVMIEYLLNDADDVVDYDIRPILISRDYLTEKFETSYKLPNDGIFKYRKLIIPTLNHFFDGDVYLTKDKYFYYNRNIYFSNTDITDLSSVKDLERVTNLILLWNNKDSQKFFWFEENLFSICNLENCLLSLQKEVIENCYYKKCTSDLDLKFKRDFILDSVFVLKHLIAMHNYQEAQRILNNLLSCDSTLCGNTNKLGGCGCGKTV